jgi:hypothetical protein
VNGIKHSGWYVHPEFRRSGTHILFVLCTAVRRARHNSSLVVTKGVEAIAKMSRTIGRLPLASGNQGVLRMPPKTPTHPYKKIIVPSEPRKKTKTSVGSRRTNKVGS